MGCARGGGLWRIGREIERAEVRTETRNRVEVGERHGCWPETNGSLCLYICRGQNSPCHVHSKCQPNPVKVVACVNLQLSLVTTTLPRFRPVRLWASSPRQTPARRGVGESKGDGGLESDPILRRRGSTPTIGRGTAFLPGSRHQNRNQIEINRPTFSLISPAL